MRELYFIKIGGGSISDQNKPMVARRDVIERLLKEIYDAKKEKGFDVIIGNGAGSFGHVPAKQYRVNEGFVNEESRKGAALTKAAANTLNTIVLDIGANMGMPVFSFSPSSFCVADGKRITDGGAESIKLALEKGFIPLVHGDVMIDKKLGVCIASTEEVMRFLAGELRPTKVIICCDVDGFFDKNPLDHNDAKLIKLVNGKNLNEVLAGAGGAKKVDVTGGMKTKVELLHNIVEKNKTRGYLVNATKAGYLNKLLSGEEKSVPCTVVEP